MGGAERSRGNRVADADLLGDAKKNGQAALDFDQRICPHTPEDRTYPVVHHCCGLVHHHLRHPLQAVLRIRLQGDAQQRRVDERAGDKP